MHKYDILYNFDYTVATVEYTADGWLVETTHFDGAWTYETKRLLVRHGDGVTFERVIEVVKGIADTVMLKGTVK